MAMHGSSRDRSRLWLVMLTAIGAALASLLALLQWDTPVWAEEAGQGEIQPQIVGGQSVPNGKYPFMAVLSIRKTAGSYLCGGTLIDPNSVLTAAHCVVDAQRVRLAVGRTVSSRADQGKVRSARRIFIPSSYNGSADDRYDAAVLKLNKRITSIQPIKLATAKQDGLERPGRNLTVAGWGTTSEDGNTSDRMREVSVPVVSDDDAQDSYPDTYFPKFMVAAGVEDRDSCQGDSGGPLFKPGAPRAQVGIVSVGTGCARAGVPGVYTEVNNRGVRSFIVDAAQR